MSMESAYFQISDITGNHDSKELKRKLGAFRGVLSVSVNAEKNSLAVDYDNIGITSDRLERQLEQLGYRVESCKTENHIM